MAKEKKSSTNWIILGITLFILFIVSVVVAGFIAMFISSDSMLFGNVAHIKINGIIVSSKSDSLFGGGVVASEDIVELIQEANEDSSIKAILFEINSPGGAAVPSDEIGKAIKAFEKPTVAWIRDVGASGGYWVASATDIIVANPMSITGSIGVTSSYLEFSGLLQNYNVTYERLVTGQYKDMGTPFKALSSEERDILQSKLDKIHDIFVKEVAQNRNLDEDTVRALSTGMFYLGIEAKELGLIDVLGGKEEAEEILMEQTGLTSINFVKLQKKPSFWESLSQVFSGSFLDIRQNPKIELR